jgi:hypothetical protein
VPDLERSVSDLTVMQLSIGGRPWRLGDLKEALDTWATAQHMERLPAGTPAHPEDLEVGLLSAEGGVGWLDVYSRGDRVLSAAVQLAQGLARLGDRRLRLVASGAGPGSGHHTILAYERLRVGRDGRLQSESLPAADQRLTRNPIPDDCPYEDFDDLMAALLLAEGREAEPNAVERLLLRPRKLDTDPRVDRLIREAIVAREARLVPWEGGRLALRLVHSDGSREVAVLTPAQAERVRPFLHD